MTHAEVLMNYLIKKNPDATIKDWKKAMKEIAADRPKPYQKPEPKKPLTQSYKII